MSWMQILKLGPPETHKDIPDEYMQKAIEYWAKQNLSDKILGRAWHTNKDFWEEFEEVSGGNIDIKFTPEMVISMRKTWVVLMTDVPMYLMNEYKMYGWHEEENNKLLVKKLSEAFADYMNNMPREGERRLE